MYKCDPTRGVGFPGPFPSRQGVSAPSRQGVSAERERPLPAALADLLLGILNHGYAIPVLSYNPHELWGPRPFPASRKPTPLVTPGGAASPAAAGLCGGADGAWRRAAWTLAAMMEVTAAR